MYAHSNAYNQGTLRLHIRRLSTHVPYPGAISPVLHRPIRFPLRSALIQIVDDCVAIFFTVEEPDEITHRLIIWNWREGNTCVVSMFPAAMKMC